jgi:endonuclease/exonuclease/phosphatase family metal-dependent hydrolase
VPLQIATYNIRNGDADDGSNSWLFRREALVKMLQRLDADVLGLQEVMVYQLQYILEQLPEYDFVGVGRIDGREEGEYAPILYRKDRFQANGAGWFWLSETPEIPGSKSWDTACERICTWASFESPGLQIMVMNAHLDHISEEAQLRGAQLIAARSGAGPAIAMGDFNTLPGSPPIQAFQEAGFQDSGLNLEGSTFHDWGKTEYGRIDYILARQILIGRAQIVEDKIDGRHASDHYPVVATVG